jgi:hypothetical protein
LVTKIILGTFGCLPAVDRYFVLGFKGEGHPYSYLNDRFVACALNFCRTHHRELQQQQADIEQGDGIRYPLMKLVDMHFWQLGVERDKRRGPGSELE